MMTSRRKLVFVIVCLIFDLLCLASSNFAIDTKGFMLLTLCNYLFYLVFSRVRLRRSKHRDSADSGARSS